MIKTNELRIGNYLQLPTRKLDLIVVEGVYENNTVLCDATSNEWPVENYKPIPLTEQWLIDLGFKKYEKMGGFHYFIHDFLEITHYCEFIFRYTGEQIKYVHQLQNLFFALNQEELKLNK